VQAPSQRHEEINEKGKRVLDSKSQPVSEYTSDLGRLFSAGVLGVLGVLGGQRLSDSGWLFAAVIHHLLTMIDPTAFRLPHASESPLDVNLPARHLLADKTTRIA
jgi:hypothetical protein